MNTKRYYFLLLLVVALVSGCATRGYVDEKLRHDNIREAALYPSYKQHQELCREVAELSKRIDKCVVAGPYLRATLQAQVDRYEEIEELERELEKIKRRVKYQDY